ncbi:MAG: hypothetical protein KAW17_03180 [Candidatus Eisenbacteria sp.]|nr:hypothetical protein [Candidatus Eisenbacteria bacterium]
MSNGDLRRRFLLVMALLPMWLHLPVIVNAAPPSMPVSPSECHRMLGQGKVGLARGLADRPTLKSGQAAFDVLHYDLVLRVDPADESLVGDIGIHVASVIASLDSVVLDFVVRPEMTVDSASVDGQAAGFRWGDDAVRIAMPAGLAAGESSWVRVWYHGQPETPTVGFGFGVTPRGHPTIWTLSEPEMARFWWPCKDAPSDKATATISIRVPEPLMAVSNGLLLEIESLGDGTRTWHWSETYPIATYLVSLAICEYDVFEDSYVTTSGDSMPVIYYVYPEHRSRAERDFRFTVDMIEFYASVFGEYPFLREKYGMAEFPWGGAMEHQTVTSYGSPLITGTNIYDWIIAHELAHQWWGDLVTLETWDDIWLNEGFAVYSEALWEEHIAGEGAYHAYMAAMDRKVGFSGTLYGPSADPDSAFMVPYVYTVYDKGAWVLHMLRHVVGDSVFFQILRDYASHTSHAYRTANTVQFQALAEDHHGRSLDWFFTKWVYGTGRPEYEYRWTTRTTGGQHLLMLHIDQVQTASGVFEMPLDVAVEFASGETTFVVVDSLECQDFEVVLEKRPVAVVLDPEGWVLKRAVERPERFALYGVCPNPFHETTRVVYDLHTTQAVEFTIYDVTGRRVTNLVDHVMSPGHHEVVWDGGNDRGERVAPGVYFGKLIVGGRENRIRLVLIR